VARPISQEEMDARRIAEGLDAQASELAARLGPAPFAKPIGDKDQLRIYRAEIPGLDAVQLYQQMVMTGQLNQQTLQQAVSTLQEAGIAQPEIEGYVTRVLELYSAGDFAAAATVAKHPWREDLLRRGRPKLGDQVRFAQHMEKLAQAEQAKELSAGATEDPMALAEAQVPEAMPMESEPMMTEAAQQEPALTPEQGY
jgi:hypothetical protein